MTAIFGTLGFTPKKLLPTVTSYPDVEKLVFYHDRHQKSRDAAARVREFCRERDLPAEGVELDAFDIIQCAYRMREDLRREGPENVIFNITGGTPVISSAATLAAILEGTRAVYLHEVTGEEISLPLLSLRYEEILNPEQRVVLRRLAAAGPLGCTQADLMRELALSRGTVSHHVGNLKRKHLVRAEAHPDDRRKEVLRVMPSAALLLMEDPE